jgi:hypothetical protein
MVHMTRENPIFVAPAPQPRSGRRGLIIAVGLLAAGVSVLALVVAGVWRSLAGGPAPLPVPPPIVLGGTPIAFTPAPAASSAAIVAPSPSPEQTREGFADRRWISVSVRWESGFYGIYATAQRTFAVNWLLVASIHKQETAFSTAPSTYHGLNFAHCCAGPMQFNVRNGPLTTWRLVRDAYRFGARPGAYNHATARHPSVYDDFDSIMAAAWLLSSDGARIALDGPAWQAAYDYYGHDATGVTYADQVLARAIGWSQTGFCINCALSSGLVAAVHAAYGVPALAQLAAHAAVAARRAASRRAKAHPPAGHATGARPRAPQRRR